MSVLPILIEGEPVLRQLAAPVDGIDEAVRTLCEDMVATMYAAPGRGLAAPQVGVARRIFVMDAFWKDGADRVPRVMLNPRVVWRSDAVAANTEGCLSILGVPVRVRRPVEVTLAWTDLEGRGHTEKLAGFEAICAQHEIDHLDGVLITDRLSDAERTERADALARLRGGSWTPGP